MYKILITFFSFVLLFSIINTASAQGQSTGMSAPVKARPYILPLPNPENNLPFGQNHNYTVNLRGNGQAIIFLKTVFSNLEEASVSAMKYSFPVQPQNLSVYQPYREPNCTYYEPAPYPPSLMNSDTEADFNNNPVYDEKLSMRYPQNVKKCSQYQEPDYLYGWGNTTYHKAEFVLSGNDLSITLPKSVKPNGSGSLILIYSLPNIANKGILGEFNFGFDTIKTTDTIQNLQAGITVDPDFYLKDAKGEINYQSKDVSTMSAPPSLAMGQAEGINNPQFDQFYSQIGQGTIVKTASNLQPNETFSVKGVYADNKFKLYSAEIGTGIGVIVLVLGLAFGALFIAVKKVFGKKEDSDDKPKQGQNFSILTVISASFGSSLLIVLNTAGIYFFSIFINQLFPFYTNNSISMILIILLTVIALCIYSILLFVPGVVIGIKKGMLNGIVTIIMTIIWLAVFGVILAGIIFIFSQNTQNPPYPSMIPMGGLESSIIQPDGITSK